MGKQNNIVKFFWDFSVVSVLRGALGCSGVFRSVPESSGVFRSVPVFRCSGAPGFSTRPLIEAKPEVRNLGAWFDSHLNMSIHRSKLCASAFYHLFILYRSHS